MSVNAGGNRHSQHSFATQPDVKSVRSQFDRSFTIKDTFDFDYLVPCYVDEILPGDTVNMTTNTFARLATQKVPIMDNMYIDFFFFFVPNRLVYDHWEQLQGAQKNPGDSTDFILPQMTFPAGGPEVGTIYDKMGLPTDVPGSWVLKNTLPLRAYNLIWNEWFRDQNLQNSINVDTDDGPDVPGDYVLKKRGKRHDYFTSALPFPQKGPAVTMPLGTSAPILRTPLSGPMLFKQAGTNTSLVAGNASFSNVAGVNNLQTTTSQNVAYDPNGGLYADLNAATAPTINALSHAVNLRARRSWGHSLRRDSCLTF